MPRHGEQRIMKSSAICGLKLTHDGAVAVIENGVLVMAIEVEKVANGPRHAPIHTTDFITEALQTLGARPNDPIDLAVDGWQKIRGISRLQVVDGNEPIGVEVAGYVATDLWQDVRSSIRIRGRQRPYTSYLHATGHIASAYCTSPFADPASSALVLVWDGGMPPTLFQVTAGAQRIVNLGVVLPLSGAAYPVMAHHLTAFRPEGRTHKWPELLGERAAASEQRPEHLLDLDISGKAMAYAGLGSASDAAIGTFETVLNAWSGASFSRSLVWAERSMRELTRLGLSDPDIMASFQRFLELALVDALRIRLAALGTGTLPLCFAGGCALNLGINSALRESGLFEDVWVPPFPNDSGSAIGAACAASIRGGQPPKLEWSVYAGPELDAITRRTERRAKEMGWDVSECTPEQIAALLVDPRAIVAVLKGHAELGPRALGHRSLLAGAQHEHARDTLNQIKGREWFRPVAPICLEEDARRIFTPGTPDPYMLYTHQVQQRWKPRIPAVTHWDGSARLQTISKTDDVDLWRLLTEYRRLTGIPVLCNTSANLKGRGFFPDVTSAMTWGRVPYIWNGKVLFTKARAANLTR